MGEQQQISLEGAVQSYALWWREAGFDTAVDEQAHGWRGTPPVPFWRREAAPALAEAIPAQDHAPAEAQLLASSAPKIQARPAPTQMPGTLPAFLDWMAQDTDQPEAAWDGALILPPAQFDARLLIIVEMPMPGAADNATLIEAGQRRFIDAMLASLGLTPDDALLTSMAAKRPHGGMIDEPTLTQLSARMTHYLGLARPESVIILGDRTSRALLGAQRASHADALPVINHPGGTIDAVALASPELLMSRPMAKAKSWQALRLLQRNLNA